MFGTIRLCVPRSSQLQCRKTNPPMRAYPSPYNVYCAESLHPGHSGIAVTALGAVICATSEARALSKAARALKTKHGLKPDFETKWPKVSPAKIEFYLALVDLLLDDGRLDFRGVVMAGAGRPGRSRNLLHDELYRAMLGALFCTPCRYRVYLGVKDTLGGERMRRLREMFDGADRRHIERVQQVRTQEH